MHSAEVSNNFLGYQVFVSELHHFWGIKVLFLYYVLSNMWGFFSPHTQKPLRNLKCSSSLFYKVSLFSNLLHRNKGKHFCPAWEDLPPKQGLSKPRVSWGDVDTWTNVIRKILFAWEKVCSHNATLEIRQMSPFSRILELLTIYFCSEQGILSVGLLLCCLFLTDIYFRPSYSPSHIWPEQQRAGSKQQLCSS